MRAEYPDTKHEITLLATAQHQIPFFFFPPVLCPTEPLSLRICQGTHLTEPVQTPMKRSVLQKAPVCHGHLARVVEPRGRGAHGELGQQERLCRAAQAHQQVLSHQVKPELDHKLKKSCL